MELMNYVVPEVGLEDVTPDFLPVDATLDKEIFDLFNQEQLGKGVEVFEREAPSRQHYVPTLPGDSGSSDESEAKPRTSSATSSYGDGLDGNFDTHFASTASRKRSVSDCLDVSNQHREKRLARNRESAALSRWRKKTTMESLSVQNRELERNNSRLNYMLACSNAEVQALRAQLVRYQSASTADKAVPPPTSSSESAVGVLPGQAVYPQGAGFPCGIPSFFPPPVPPLGPKYFQ